MITNTNHSQTALQMIHSTSTNTPWSRTFALNGDTAVPCVVRSALEAVMFAVARFLLSNWGKAEEERWRRAASSLRDQGSRTYWQAPCKVSYLGSPE